MSRKEFRTLADPEEAHAAIASLDLEPDPETVPLAEARGRILAERIDAELDVPGFDRASMDGYALRARDTFGADEAEPAVLELVGEVHAGEEPNVEVGEGEAAEISTGAVVPPGADAVVMVERTDRVERSSTESASSAERRSADHSSGQSPREDGDEGTASRDGNVEIRTSVAPGDNVMFAGADIAAGERALGPGTELTPREIGLLSALGIEEVPVRGKPDVGIVSTGDELVRPGGDLDSDAGQIYDVNSYTTAAAIEEAGGEPVFYPHAGDDYDELESILTEAAAECDLVLSSGSTSASAVDVIYEVIEQQGELLLHGVAVKPGKPMLIGRLDDSAYIGLPGYPVSALTIFQTFVAPAIRRAAGVPEPRTATIEGEMAVRERYGEGRRRLMPVGLVEDDAGKTLVYPVDKGSGATTSLVEADGIVSVHADTEYLDLGETVEVQLFSSEVRPPTAFGVGEDDPALSRLLDEVRRPRFLGIGSRDGLRRLRNGVPDFAVTSGPVDPAEDYPELGGWEREWGLVVAPENPENIEGLADLIEGDCQFVNRTTASGLRQSFDEALESFAADHGEGLQELRESIRGYDLAVRAHESPARKVIAGKADAGLGLHATAEKLGLGFVPLGTEEVRVYANEERTEKPGVATLSTAIEEVEGICAELPGYEPQ